uniref:FYVE-type domain-containing protein n=1 Tax=Hyaloperonospora arabidopsidis (strain Emoy2) TaxID=559515 RepID=M4B3R0_HYAAE
MDRFRLDGVDHDGVDTVEPMRPSSFDMTFSLGSYPCATQGISRESESQAPNPKTQEENVGVTNGSNKRQDRGQKGRLHVDELMDSSRSQKLDPSSVDSSVDPPMPTTAGASSPPVSSSSASASHKDVATIALRLEEKAHEAIDAANLCGRLSWKLAKRTQDVHVYRPATLPSEEDASTKLYFRVSCEVKAHLGTIMEYLTPSNSRNYFDIESQVFPGLLHAAVIKRMELPERAASSGVNSGQTLQFPTGASATTTASDSHDDASSVGEDASEAFPHLQVKWHASRFAGRFVKPVDFFFVEYANIETMADGKKRGYGYIRSVESFKGDELAIRLAGEDVVIPSSVAKCKRAVINKGVYLVSPSDDASGTYKVTCMMVIDFQKQFATSVGAKIIQNFTDRLIGIRELLFNTLFRPIAVLSKNEWKPARSNKCAICICSFSIVKSKHHCRSCGEAVCGQCSRKWTLQPGAQPEAHARLCTSCSLQARSYLTPNGEPSRSPAGASSRFSSVLSNIQLAGSRSNVSRKANDHKCDVQVASTVSTDPDVFAAATSAFAKLVTALGDQNPHFMLVSYSHHHNGAAVYEALARAAPDTLFMGGTSSGGVYVGASSPAIGLGQGSNTNSNSRHRQHVRSATHETVGLWGIYDPEGSYAILNADLDRESPRDAARRCLLDGMRMLAMEPEESPDFVWTVLGCEDSSYHVNDQRDGEEEQITRAVNEIVDCSYSVVGGSSSRYAANGSLSTTQVCSEGGSTGCVTEHGVCFAICCPSVEVAHALFTCYDATEKTFVVTKASGRELFALDHKPALEAINEATHGMLTEMTQRPEKFNLESSLLPAYYPVARERRGAVPRGFKRSSSRYQILQPEASARDLSLHMGAEVCLGERLHMMSLSPQGMASKARRGLRDAVRISIPTMDLDDVIGCFLSVGISYDRVMQGDLKAVADASGSAFPHGASFLSVSHGQQGVMAGGNEAVHANSMMTALIVTNRKKSQKLRPLTLRRRVS